MSTGKVDYGQVYIITSRRLLVNKTSIFAIYKVKKPNEKKVMFIFSTLYRVHKSRLAQRIHMGANVGIYHGVRFIVVVFVTQQKLGCNEFIGAKVCIYIHRCALSAVLRPPLLVVVVVVVLRNLAQRLYRVNTY